MNKEIFGYLGAFFLTVTLIPQLILTFRSKKTDDISYGFIALQIITCIFFLIYGILLEAMPLILANSTVLTQLLLLGILKLKYSYFNLDNLTSSASTF